MQINFNNGTSFNGIKLSSNDYDKIRLLAKKLESYGYSCLGHNTFICNNTANDKISLAQKIRNKAYFFSNGFGAIFLPWSKEVYFMSTPANEQKIYSIVKKFDEGAVLNLAI